MQLTLASSPWVRGLCVAGLLIALACGGSASVQAQPVHLEALSAAPTASAMPVAFDILRLFGLSAGIGDLMDKVDDMANDFWGDYGAWGKHLYGLLFVLQFMLMGATMLVRGPFAIASYRTHHHLNPFANFFFYLVAGWLGYLLVANSYYVAGGVEHGWVSWLYDFFSEAGHKTGCERGAAVFHLVDNCSPDGLATLGMRMSGALTVMAQNVGTTPSNPLSYLIGSGGASSGVFGAYSVLAVQMAITQIAFKLTIVMAPLFLASIVFRPFSGMATGYLSFVLYLGVKLFVLYIVAGMANYVAVSWLQAMATSALVGLLTGVVTSGAGAADAGQLFSFNLSVLTMSMLFLALTLYLPQKVAQAVSGHFQLDLNAILFRGEMPIE